MRLVLPVKVLAGAALAAALALPARAFDDIDALPEGPGREEAFYTCIACHSMQVVTRQGMSRAMWEDTVTLMVTRHGMPEPEEEDRAAILDYLSAHFPPGTGTEARRGRTNPFAP